MGHTVQFKVLYYGIEKEEYCLRGDFSSGLFQYEKNLVHRINRFYFSQMSESLFAKEVTHNWGFIIHPSHLVLFDIGTDMRNEKNYVNLKGWVFEPKDIHWVWINLCEIIMLMKTKKDIPDGRISADELYAFRRKTQEEIIPKRIYEFIREDFIPKSFVCTNLVGEIWTQIPHIFYAASVIEPQCSSYIRKEDWNTDLQAYVQEYYDRFKRYGNVNLEYEIPNMKNRSGQESYFKERKKIKTAIKNKSANWQLHTVANQKHYVSCLGNSMNNLSFCELEQYYAGMRERIDRGD